MLPEIHPAFIRKLIRTNMRAYSMYGNPNLGQVQAIFLGVENISNGHEMYRSMV